jgi:hypothetical protein
MVETFVQSTDDVVRFLKDQHNLIKDMFEEVFSASSDDARRKAFTELRQLLAVHETAEEMVVHPRVRHEVEGGDIIVDARLVEEHDWLQRPSRPLVRTRASSRPRPTSPWARSPRCSTARVTRSPLPFASHAAAHGSGRAPTLRVDIMLREAEQTGLRPGSGDAVKPVETRHTGSVAESQA